jgi:hypothetical protein
MARYNTAVPNSSVATTATVAAPAQGTGIITLTGTSGYTVTLPSPALYPGQYLTYVNNTGGSCTLSTPSGTFAGPSASGASTQTIYNTAILSCVSDSTNYYVISEGANDLVTQGLTVNGALSATSTNASTFGAITELLQTISGATGTVTHNFQLGTIFYHTSIAANFTANFTNMPTTNNRTIACTLILNQGGAGYYPSAVQVNGNAVTLRWANNATPSPSTSKIDTVAFTFWYTGSTWYCLGQYTLFA